MHTAKGRTREAGSNAIQPFWEEIIDEYALEIGNVDDQKLTTGQETVKKAS
jgi:hypothetical protein